MNIVVESSPWLSSDLPTLFGDEPVEQVPDMDLSQLAVYLGAYPSTTKARQAGRVGPIPPGWTEWKVSKIQRAWIWNPTE